jgi:hypothetical protein
MDKDDVLALLVVAFTIDQVELVFMDAELDWLPDGLVYSGRVAMRSMRPVFLVITSRNVVAGNWRERFAFDPPERISGGRRRRASGRRL